VLLFGNYSSELVVVLDGELDDGCASFGDWFYKREDDLELDEELFVELVVSLSVVKV
jgi:hypothetical protein